MAGRVPTSFRDYVYSMKRLLFCFCLVVGCLAHGATVYTMTGASSPALLTYDADTLAQTGGINQGTVAIVNDLAFDQTGRLFGVSALGLLEFDPTTRAIVHQSPIGAGAGIAVRNGTIYTLTEGFPSVALVTYDANTLAQTGGVGLGSNAAVDSLAFDQTGRLFGLSGIGLLEFNPTTLAIIHQSPPGLGGSGIAVRNGTLYTLLNTFGSVGLVTYDADTFAQTGGTGQGFIALGDDLAFDENGRLFGVTSLGLREFNPTTLAVIQQSPYVGTFGIAVRGVPEPSVSLLTAIASACVAGLYRKRW